MKKIIESTIRRFKNQLRANIILLYRKYIRGEWRTKAKVLYYIDDKRQVIYGLLMPDGTITKPTWLFGRSSR